MERIDKLEEALRGSEDCLDCAQKVEKLKSLIRSGVSVEEAFKQSHSTPVPKEVIETFLKYPPDDLKGILNA